MLDGVAQSSTVSIDPCASPCTIDVSTFNSGAAVRVTVTTQYETVESTTSAIGYSRKF